MTRDAFNSEVEHWYQPSLVTAFNGNGLTSNSCMGMKWS